MVQLCSCVVVKVCNCVVDQLCSVAVVWLYTNFWLCNCEVLQF